MVRRADPQVRQRWAWRSLPRSRGAPCHAPHRSPLVRRSRCARASPRIASCRIQGARSVLRHRIQHADGGDGRRYEPGLPEHGQPHPPRPHLCQRQRRDLRRAPFSGHRDHHVCNSRDATRSETARARQRGADCTPSGAHSRQYMHDYTGCKALHCTAHCAYTAWAPSGDR